MALLNKQATMQARAFAGSSVCPARPVRGNLQVYTVRSSQCISFQLRLLPLRLYARRYRLQPSYGAIVPPGTTYSLLAE